MPILSDKWIRRMSEEHGMIEPFEPKQVRDGTISYGLSSFGYDIRVGDEYKVFTDVHSVVVDPKSFDPRSFVEFKGEYCIIPPHSFRLAANMEYFRIPNDVLVVCVGKSTYARCGIIVDATPLNLEWPGFLKPENFKYDAACPPKSPVVKAPPSCCFFRATKVPEITYPNKKGQNHVTTGGFLFPALLILSKYNIWGKPTHFSPFIFTQLDILLSCPT